MKNTRPLSVRDVLIGGILAAGLWLLLFFMIGFYREGLNSPLTYDAGDDFTLYASVKNMGENGTFWSNQYLGAPDISFQYDFTASFLQNTEMALSKIIYLFTNEPVKTVNIQFLMIFALCGFVSYLVLRALGIRITLAIAGSISYALVPYIFVRGVGHFCLSACYFVPLSILLCVWAYEKDPGYMAFNKQFFLSKTTYITLAFCFLIANNGIAYYPFFTCFFLCAVAVMKALEERSVRAAVPSLKIVFFIVIFVIAALLPSILFQIRYGSNLEITDRPIFESELFGLKITQLFIPIFDHGSQFLRQLRDTYNSQMPCVNENATAFLGIFGGIGFIASMIDLFSYGKAQKDHAEGMLKRNSLFSRLNLAAILLATIGGFSSLITVLLNKCLLRGHNRISVFIMFISICFLLHMIESAANGRLKFLQNKILSIVLLSVTVIIIILDQTPGFHAYTGLLAANRTAYESDLRFMARIEDELQDDDMVFQLPYHAYPETGPVNNMPDYSLLRGYICSHSLRWSYGSVKGRNGDALYKKLASGEISTILRNITEEGFRGLYIDKRAYTEEEWDDFIESVNDETKQEPIVSDDGMLFFYDLSNYCETTA